VNQRIIGTNPLDKIKPLPVDDFGSRALEPNEVEDLLAFSPPHWRDIWYAYLVTGMRNQELAKLKFDDIDWEAREVIVRAVNAKNGRERRIPIDDGLWEILKNLEAGRGDRRPGTNRNPKYSAQVREKFTTAHVFVSTANSWMRTGCVHASLMRCCKKAGIVTRVFNDKGELVTRVDVHSLRKTFATELIEQGADPKSVQELLGHRTLEITMKLYARIRKGTKRQAMGRLSYGKGAAAPAHLVEFPGGKSGHKTSTIASGADGEPAQAVAE
jgi:integrase